MSTLDPARWRALWERLGTLPPADSFTRLAQAYSEPHRRYHSTEHILACLAQLEHWRTLALQPDRVELALWTHDLVYDTRRQDNEAASAEQTCIWLQQAGLESHAPALREMILATTHAQPAPDPDAALVVDIDLSILATSPEIYAGYQTAVRAEFAWVPEPLFRNGRARLLRGLLDMPALYQTPQLAARWELQARANLTRELAELDG